MSSILYTCAKKGRYIYTRRNNLLTDWPSRAFGMEGLIYDRFASLHFLFVLRKDALKSERIVTLRNQVELTKVIRRAGLAPKLAPFLKKNCTSLRFKGATNRSGLASVRSPVSGFRPPSLLFEKKIAQQSCDFGG